MNHEAITLDNPLPPAVVVVDSAAMSRINALAQRAMTAAAVADSEGGLWAERAHFDAASAIYGDMRNIERMIEDNRKLLKAPVLQYGRDLDAAAARATTPLQEARDVLGVRLAKYQKHLDDIAELARIEAERAKVEAMERARAERQRAADAAMADLTGDAAPEQPQADHDAVALPDAPAPAPKVVRMQTVYTLEIVDASAVPREFLVPDEGAIKRAMRDGATVPGCVLHSEQKPVATGR